MNNNLKYSAAVVALVLAPAMASADSLAVSFSATFGDQAINLDGAASVDCSETSSGINGCNAGEVNIDSGVTSDATLDVADDQLTVSRPTSISAAAATGSNASASSAATSLDGQDDVTSANAGAGDNVVLSAQYFDVEDGEFISGIAFTSEGLTKILAPF